MPSKRTTCRQSCVKNAPGWHFYDYASGVFIIAWFWHLKVVGTLYNFLLDIGGKKLLANVVFLPESYETFKEKFHLGSPEVNRDFAFIAAFTHTIVFCFGLISAALFRRFNLLTIFNKQQQKIDPQKFLITFTLMIWFTALFHRAAWEFLRFCFTTKYKLVFDYAKLFFNHEKGEAENPFAWASSVSYSAALFLGLLLNVDWHSVEISKNGPAGAGKRDTILHKIYSWVRAIGLPFIVWALTLDKATLPFLNEMENIKKIDGLNLDQGLGTRNSIAYVLGMCMCCAVPTSWVAFNSVFSLIESNEPGVIRKSLYTEIYSCIRDVVKTCIISFCISSIFLTLSLFNEFSIENLVKSAFSLLEVFSQQKFILILFVLTIIFLLVMYSKNLTSTYNNKFSKSENPKKANKGSNKSNNDVSKLNNEYFRSQQAPLLENLPPWLRKITTFCFIGYMWNCHLVGFWGNFMPYQLYSYYLNDPTYTAWNAFMDGWMMVLTVTYVPSIIGQGGVKQTSAKLKADWGMIQETIIGLFLTVPLSVMMYFIWVNNHKALPIHLIIVVIHLLYMSITYSHRPEINGGRDWPALKRFRMWELMMEYFDQQIICEDENKNTIINTYDKNFFEQQNKIDSPWKDGKDKARIIGYCPHGIFPAGLLWFHMTPLWRTRFKDLEVCALTDALIHCIPFAREFAQWSGGLEVSREVVHKKLKNNQTIALIPGGQGEILLHSNENFAAKKAVICDKHSGFCRIALENDAEVVPLYVFGELKGLQNINFTPMQKATRKIFGFPLPFFPVGIWGILPIPLKTRMTYCFGKPLKGKCNIKGKPTKDEVKDLHDKFYIELLRICEKHKEQAGHKDWTFHLRSQVE